MIELIPAIDIIEGKCVRLTQGCYNNKKQYNYSPLEYAKMFESSGLRRLHIVDLDGAKVAHIVNIEILREIAEKTSLKIDFGGGIRSKSDLETAFEAGASMVTIGSLAVTDPEIVSEWINTYGPDHFIIGADVRNERISINGWQNDGKIELSPLIRLYYERGIRQILCTDISRDGMLQGPALQLYETVMNEFPDLHLIASGGVSSVKDIQMLDKAGVPAVVFGKSFYEGHIQLNELSEYTHSLC